MAETDIPVQTLTVSRAQRCVRPGWLLLTKTLLVQTVTLLCRELAARSMLVLCLGQVHACAERALHLPHCRRASAPPWPPTLAPPRDISLASLCAPVPPLHPVPQAPSGWQGAAALASASLDNASCSLSSWLQLMTRAARVALSVLVSLPGRLCPTCLLLGVNLASEPRLQLRRTAV